MSEEPVLFPDVEALVVRFLADRPELADVSIGINLPAGFDGNQRAAVVSRVGGAFTEYQRLDSALTEIETYGPDKQRAHELARQVRALVARLPHERHEGAVVSDVSEDEGPRWRPDTRSDANRYVTRLRLLVHPASDRTSRTHAASTSDSAPENELN